MFKHAERLGIACAIIAGASAAALAEPATVEGATFDVTSTSCAGPGSIVEAILQANAAPGPDTISITPGLQIGPVNAGQCAVDPTVSDPADFYLATVTDDVTIVGDGVRMWGDQKWVTSDGGSFNAGKCPGFFDSIVSRSPGFVRVDGADLSVEGIEFENLSAFARLGAGSALHLDEVSLVRIFDFFQSCTRPPIDVAPSGDATISIKDSRFRETFNATADNGPFKPPFDPVVNWGSPTIAGSGSLTVEGSVFEENKGSIQWTGGSVDVVSSQFGIQSGWINASGGATVDVVNSAFDGGVPGTWIPQARIYAQQNSTVNIIASTLVVGLSDCPDRSTPQNPDAQCVGGPGVIQSKTGSTINVSQSAFGVQIDGGVPALVTSGGTITADAQTWMQPLPGATPPQDAAALRTITSQPSLLTDPPGLPQGLARWPDSHTPLLGDTMTPGVLIDVIPDSDCGNTNQVLSPIDGTCLTTDVLGNSRWDGNGRRNIGAVQNTLAPHLVVAATGDGSVDLSWSQLVVPNVTVTGYAVLYREAGSGAAFTRVDVAGQPTVTQTVTGLTNGTSYEFEVVGVSASGDGPPSNQVTATPSTVPQAPTVTTTPGDGQIEVSWTVPPDGGAPIEGYLVQYRPVGTTDWQTLPFEGTGTTAVVAGLTNGTPYEFRVAASNRNGAGPFSSVVEATPTATPPTTATPPPTSTPPPTTATPPPTSTPPPTTATPPPTSTPPPTTTAPILPETGAGTTLSGIAAAVFVLLGVAIVFATRRSSLR